MFCQVPVLAVVVPLAAAVLAVLLRSLVRRGRLSVPRAAVAVVLCIYAAGVVANTVFPIYLDKPVSSAPWTSSVVVVPWTPYEVADAVMNILVFVPLGFLMPLVVARVTWWRAAAAAAVVSLGIEVTQVVTAHLLGGGHVADVHDLLFNVVGGALGYVAFVALSRVRAARALVIRFRWYDDAPERADAARPEPVRGYM
ncbi:VanZ family protein [Cellulomonas sp. H30R-01]|uniref:VanZ family protein n=1 Tax=Cellulomonas sp. H30R-01 TaxID=2704467 RepID=UPI00138CA0A0|nr:VanZ family protein [Cellulomonas sp. H30R-01]QHT57636.1 VanZ family protein [Cellulomonas sp. H30R-01]